MLDSRCFYILVFFAAKSRHKKQRKLNVFLSLLDEGKKATGISVPSPIHRGLGVMLSWSLEGCEPAELLNGKWKGVPADRGIVVLKF